MLTGSLQYKKDGQGKPEQIRQCVHIAVTLEVLQSGRVKQYTHAMEVIKGSKYSTGWL